MGRVDEKSGREDDSKLEIPHNEAMLYLIVLLPFLLIIGFYGALLLFGLVLYLIGALQERYFPEKNE